MKVTTETCPGKPGHVQLVDECFHGAQASIVHDPDAEEAASEAMAIALDLCGARMPEEVVSVTIERRENERLSAQLAGFQAAVHLAREQGLTTGKFAEKVTAAPGESPRRFIIGEVTRGPRRYQIYVTDWHTGWGAFETEITTEARFSDQGLGRGVDRLPDAAAIARDHIAAHMATGARG